MFFLAAALAFAACSSSGSGASDGSGTDAALVECDRNNPNACPGGQSCLCCPAGGPLEHCLCTTACTDSSKCTDPARPSCNLPPQQCTANGLCTPAGFQCCWCCR